MKQFKSFQAPIFAFFSTQFYRDLAANGTGVGCKYLYCLLLVACLITPIRTLPGYVEHMNATIGSAVAEFPDITIKSGELSINKDSPLVIYDPDSGMGLIEFDAVSDRTRTNDTVVLLSKHDAFVRMKEDQEDMRFPLKDIGDTKLTQQDLKKMFEMSVYIVPVLGYMLAVPMAWLFYFVQAFFLAVMGIIVGKFITAGIGFAGALRISVCAVGCGVILDGVSRMVDVSFPLMEAAHWELIKLIVVIVYTLFGVGANLSKPTFEPVHMEGGPDSARERS